MITVIHPSRGRATQAYTAMSRCLRNATTDIEYILSIDSDDPELNDYLLLFKQVKVLVKNNRSCIDAINNAALEAKGNIFIVLSDDFNTMPIGWDKIIIDATANREDWILKTFDGTQRWIITMPIMDRKYYNRFGYIYNPEYNHMFCDTEMTAVADLLDRKIERLDIIFMHNHYSIVGGKDAVNKKNDKTWDQGKALYLRRHKENYGLKNTKGVVRNNSHLKWIDANS